MDTRETDEAGTRSKRADKELRRTGELVSIVDQIEHAKHVEAVQTARALAIAGLPKRRTHARDLSRTLRVGADMWLRVTYTAQEGHDLPFGEDRFVLAGIQHLALKHNSPTVLFDRVGSLLQTFGLNEDGRTVARLRQRFARLAGLSVRLAFGSSEAELKEHVHVEQVFLIQRYALPSRRDLQIEQAGQLTFHRAYTYGVVLSGDFWNHLLKTRNRLVVPLNLLKLYIDKPTGWDYLCFLVARCGAAKTSSRVPHEALVSLFRDTDQQDDRHVIRRLQRYHREIMHATGGRLNADLVEDGAFPSSGGRPKKRWALIVRPSRSLFALPQDLIEI